MASVLPAWLWHPLGQCAGTFAEQTRCKSYNLWSGSVSDISEITLLVSGLVALVTVVRMARKTYQRHYECHEDGCSKHGTFLIEGGVRCCEEHYPATDKRPVADRGRVHRLHVAHLEHVERHRQAA